MFVLRFDLRIPPGSTLAHAEQYRHALDDDAIVTELLTRMSHIRKAPH